MLPKVKAVPKQGAASSRSTQPEVVQSPELLSCPYCHFISDPEALMDIKGKPYDLFADTLLVRCSDDGLEAAVSIEGKKADQAQRAHEVVPGVYHMVGAVNGSPTYRQKQCSEGEPRVVPLSGEGPHWLVLG